MCENSSNSSRGKGNTKQPSPAKNWSFTMNYAVYNGEIQKVEEVVPMFQEFLDICNDRSLVKKFVFQEEIGKNKNTHLQGNIEFVKKKRPFNVFKGKGLGGVFEAIHWEKTKYPDDAFKYCFKKDSRAPWARIWGHPMEKITKAMKYPLREIRPVLYEELRDEQKEIFDMFSGDPPRFGRHIYWFWEEKGQWGKSILRTAMVDQLDCMFVEGANKDILSSLADWVEANGDAPRVMIFDIPRAAFKNISYKTIESVLGGCVFSSKYQSRMIRFNPPWVIVLANWEPDYDTMSDDRWVVRNVREKPTASGGLGDTLPPPANAPSSGSASRQPPVPRAGAYDEEDLDEYKGDDVEMMWDYED